MIDDNETPYNIQLFTRMAQEREKLLKNDEFRNIIHPHFFQKLGVLRARLASCTKDSNSLIQIAKIKIDAKDLLTSIQEYDNSDGRFEKLISDLEDFIKNESRNSTIEQLLADLDSRDEDLRRHESHYASFIKVWKKYPTLFSILPLAIAGAVLLWRDYVIDPFNDKLYKHLWNHKERKMKDSKNGKYIIETIAKQLCH